VTHENILAVNGELDGRVANVQPPGVFDIVFSHDAILDLLERVNRLAIGKPCL
jgi:hypothetical protein